MLPAALLAFAAGTLALQWQASLPPVAPWLSLACACAVLAFACTRHAAQRVPHASHAAGVGWWRLRGRAPAVASFCLTTCAAAALGFAYASHRAEVRLGDVLPEAWEGVDLRVVGVVDELPARTARGTRFAFVVEAVEPTYAHVPRRVSLAWHADLRSGAGPPPVHAGERWQLVVRLRRPRGNVNPHGFDLESWLLERNLRATGYVRAGPANERRAAFAGRPRDYVERAREAVRERILSALADAPYAGVLVALAIGEQRAIPDAQWAVFNRTGITHLISISGLHVTAFAALAATAVGGIARRIPCVTMRMPARRIAALAGVLAAAAYVALAGAQVPAQRTLVMVMVAALGLGVARPGTAHVVWLWALAAVLAWDPWAGLAPGFWLSFGAVALLLYAATCRLRWHPAGWRTRAWRALCAAGRAQALITVGLVPLTLALFQQVSLIAPVANALAIPVVTFLVVPLALLGVVVPIDTPWHVAHAVFAALMQPLALFARWPGAMWAQQAPPAWTVAVAMAGVAWMAAPRGVPLRALALLALLPMHVARPPPLPPGSVRTTVLDVGQGLAVVVRTRTHAVLFDAGPRYTDEADAGNRIVAPFLRGEGITRLDAIVLSHLDSDHTGGAASVLETVPVQRLLSSMPDDHALLATARARGAAVAACVPGITWTWDEVRFAVLHPPPAFNASSRVRTNDRSCVLRIEAPGGAVLLAGDIEARAEAELLATHAGALRTDVLVVPHHGSRTSSTPAFVAATAPRVAVVASGYRNRFGHPRADVIARYVDAGAHIARTDLDGAITIDLHAHAQDLAVISERKRDPRYWRAR